MEYYIKSITDSVRCVVGVRSQAITQVKQLRAGPVLGSLGWVTVGPRPAHRNAEWHVIFQRLVDWRQTLLNGQLYRHRFSAVFLCPRAKAIRYRREWLWSHSEGGTEKKKGYKEINEKEGETGRENE